MYLNQLSLITALEKDLPRDIINIIKGIFCNFYGFTIDVDNERTVSTLFDYIENNTTFSHVIFNGLPYYERTNVWSFSVDHAYFDCKRAKTKPFSDRPDYDADIICTADMIYDINDNPFDFKILCDLDGLPFNTNMISDADKTCPNSTKIIYPTGKDIVKYVIDRNKNLIKYEDDDELLEQIYDFDLDNIFLIGFNKLFMMNIDGWNHDHRGSNHC